jgi:hypothetical protein
MADDNQEMGGTADDRKAVGFCVIALGIILLLIACVGWLNERIPTPRQGPTYSNEDRALMSRPSLNGWSDSEKRQIIDAAKKLDAALYRAQELELRKNMNALGISQAEQEALIKTARQLDGR